MKTFLNGFAAVLLVVFAVFGSPLASAAGSVAVSGVIWHLVSSSDCHVEYNIMALTGTGPTPSHLQWQVTAFEHYTDWCSNVTSQLTNNTMLDPQSVVFRAGRITISGVGISIPGGSTLAFTGELIPIEVLALPKGTAGMVNVQLEAAVVGEFYVDSSAVSANALTASIAVTKTAKY